MYVKLSHALKLNVFIHDILRYESLKSLINNVAVKNFNLIVNN